jgi:hypothetical protein
MRWLRDSNLSISTASESLNRPVPRSGTALPSLRAVAGVRRGLYVVLSLESTREPQIWARAMMANTIMKTQTMSTATLR